MVSGFFLGGASQGFDQTEQQIYQQGTLKLAQQREQAAEKQQQIQNFWDSYKTLMERAQETVGHAKDAAVRENSGIPDDILTSKVTNNLNKAYGPLADMLTNSAKILNIPADPHADLSNIYNSPAPTRTMRQQAVATGAYGKEAAQTGEANARTNYLNTETKVLGGQPNGPVSMGANPGEKLLGDKTAQATETDVTDAERAVKQKYDARTIFKAEQLLGGNTQVLQGLGRLGGAERKNIQDAAADLAIARDIPPDQVNAGIAQFMGQKRAASQAGMRIGNVTVALDAAQAASKRVLAANDKVLRTQYPSLNKLILDYQEGKGNEDVIQYGIAITTLANNYAKAIGGGSQATTDAARQEAYSNLNKAWSNGQIKAAVAQMNKEIESELSGAQRALKDVTKSGGATSEDPLGLFK